MRVAAKCIAQAYERLQWPVNPLLADSLEGAARRLEFLARGAAVNPPVRSKSIPASAVEPRSGKDYVLLVEVAGVKTVLVTDRPNAPTETVGVLSWVEYDSPGHGGWNQEALEYADRLLRENKLKDWQRKIEAYDFEGSPTSETEMPAQKPPEPALCACGKPSRHTGCCRGPVARRPLEEKQAERRETNAARPRQKVVSCARCRKSVTTLQCFDQHLLVCKVPDPRCECGRVAGHRGMCGVRWKQHHKHQAELRRELVAEADAALAGKIGEPEPAIGPNCQSESNACEDELLDKRRRAGRLGGLAKARNRELASSGNALIPDSSNDTAESYIAGSGVSDEDGNQAKAENCEIAQVFEAPASNGDNTSERAPGAVILLPGSGQPPPIGFVDSRSQALEHTETGPVEPLNQPDQVVPPPDILCAGKEQPIPLRLHDIKPPKPRRKAQLEPIWTPPELTDIEKERKAKGLCVKCGGSKAGSIYASCRGCMKLQQHDPDRKRKVQIV